MKIKVLTRRKTYPKDGGAFPFGIKFEITELDDEEILRISQVSEINVNMNPTSCLILSYSFKPIKLGKEMNWIFKLQSDKDGLLNLMELENIELSFSNENEAKSYSKFILDQFTSEIKRINSIPNLLEKEEVYEIKANEGIKKIYEGAQKLLDKNSVEYKQIIEKNREAWKKLADM
jgi:hypothetical protein